MPVMDAVIKILEDEGVEVNFGIPGASILPFYDSLRRSEKIRHYLMRHEEGASHAADGYARATGKVGVFCGTSGPAGTNMVTGLYTAQVDSIPIIGITGQNIVPLLGKEAFQAVDIAEIVKPVTKKSYCVKETAQLPNVFREAFRIAREGRPGPVLIDLPVDVQIGEVEYDLETDGRLDFLTPTPNKGSVDSAVKMIMGSKRPVIVLGGGVIISNASEELTEFAEYLAIPVVTTVMGKGGIREDHPLYAGQVGVFCDTPPGNRVFLESDLVIGVGCRFGDRHTGNLGVYTKDRRFIHVDISPTQIGRIIPADLGIVSDAKSALKAMLKIAKKYPKRTTSPRVEKIPELHRTMKRRTDFDNIPIKPQRVFKEMNDFFDEETIFVTTIGLNQIFSSQLQKIYKPRHYIVCGGAGPLGWDLPAAIGVKIAKPDNTVVGITGDYGLGFMCEELAVASMYNIPIITVILDDGYLGLIRQASELFYNMNFEVEIRYDRVNKRLVDFIKLGEAFGISGEWVEKPTEIKTAFERGIEANKNGRPYIIDILIDRGTNASTGGSIDNIVERE
jgi:tartronate-semialdehyde synthase